MYCVIRSRYDEWAILYLPRLLQPLFIFLPLRFIRRTDGVLAAVGALLRLCGTVEEEVAVVTSINHLFIIYSLCYSGASEISVASISRSKSLW